jgi:branched-chain amino acid transport system substrate-binding protein
MRRVRGYLSAVLGLGCVVALMTSAGPGAAAKDVVIGVALPLSDPCAPNGQMGLIQTHHPSAICGAWASPYTISASTVTERARVPLLTQSFADQITERGDQFVFQLPAKAALMGQVSTARRPSCRAGAWRSTRTA